MRRVRLTIKGADVYRDEIDARIKMADDMIVSLSKDLTSFCEEHRNKIVVEKKGKTTNVRMSRDTTPVEWRIRIGVIAYLLRSSLDHLVWQLVLANGNASDHRNEFPIFGYGESPNVNRMLNGVANRHKHRILEVMRNISSTHLESLLKLKTLCNTDKHRHTAIAFVELTGLTPEYREKEELYDEEGRDFPAIDREDYNVEVQFKAGAQSSEKEWGPDGEVVKELGEYSATVKAVTNHILNNALL